MKKPKRTDSKTCKPISLQREPFDISLKQTAMKDDVCIKHTMINHDNNSDDFGRRGIPPS